MGKSRNVRLFVYTAVHGHYLVSELSLKSMMSVCSRNSSSSVIMICYRITYNMIAN